jgi:AAA15 family ATPase/GTPase
MIIQFSISNFLSFKEPATLSMVATALKDPSVEMRDVSFKVKGTSLNLLKSAVLLGANASGKSNLIKALHFFVDFVCNSFKNHQSDERIFVEPYRLNTSSAKEPSVMEMVLADDGSIFRYGFEVTTKKIEKEWLYQKASKPRAKEIELYYRDANRFSVHNKYPQAQELVNKKMIRDNALLLSTLAQFNDPKAVAIIHWLNNTQCITEEDATRTWKEALHHVEDRRMRQRIVAFSQFADLGIDNIEKTDGRLVSSHSLFDEKGNKTGYAMFPFEENESEGTIKYFALAYPILHALDTGSRVVIDELGAKLHPMLLEHIVSLFNSEETNPRNAQLIFTTHDTNLLGAHIFRRDQVWFTQKDSYGASQLFSLAEFKVRSSAAFERDYLMGKYGATPVMGNPENALNTQYNEQV